jgi:hypothetical protein
MRIIQVILLTVGVFALSGCSKPNPSTLIAKAESMIDDGSIKKLGRDDLVASFGHPNDEGYFSDWDNAFWLGTPENTYSVDSKWLVVNYDDNAIVKEARIVMD